MNKITIHRALVELKTIDDRIAKAIDEIEPTALVQKGKLVNGFYNQAEFETNAISKLQSIEDLIARKQMVKEAIVKANAITMVNIAGKKMTIADAINQKSIISLTQNLISNLSRKHNGVKSKFISENDRIDGVALNNAKIMLGRENEKGILPTDKDVKAIMEPFVERNKMSLVDPLGLEKFIEKGQAEIDKFEMEVDAVLSEINAVTFIEIE